MTKAIRLKLNFNRRITPGEADFVRRNRQMFPENIYPDSKIDQLTVGDMKDVTSVPMDNFPFTSRTPVRDIIDFVLKLPLPAFKRLPKRTEK